MSRIAPLTLGVLLLAAAPAQAIYVVTDLQVFAKESGVDAGDTVRFTVGPANESVVAKHAGRTYPVVYSHDGEEGAEPVTGTVGSVTLDDAAKGAFEWTIPAGAQDRNVFVSIMDGEEPVGTAHVAVGEAPPILMAADGEGAPETGDAPGDVKAERPAPGFTALAVLAAAVVVGAVLSRRGR